MDFCTVRTVCVAASHWQFPASLLDWFVDVEMRFQYKGRPPHVNIKRQWVERGLHTAINKLARWEHSLYLVIARWSRKVLTDRRRRLREAASPAAPA